MAYRDGWSGLFATAFEQSRNAMILSDAQRVIVDVNPAFVSLLGRKRDAVTGRQLYTIVAGGPLATDGDWAGALAEGRFSGVADMVHADGRTVAIQWAGSTEIVTGRRLVLFVALSVSRWGAHFRRPPSGRTAASADPAADGDRAPRGPRRVRPRDRRRAEHLPRDREDARAQRHGQARRPLPGPPRRQGARRRAHARLRPKMTQLRYRIRRPVTPP